MLVFSLIFFNAICKCFFIFVLPSSRHWIFLKRKTIVKSRHDVIILIGPAAVCSSSFVFVPIFSRHLMRCFYVTIFNEFSIRTHHKTACGKYLFMFLCINILCVYMRYLIFFNGDGLCGRQYVLFHAYVFLLPKPFFACIYAWFIIISFSTHACWEVQRSPVYIVYIL